MEPQVNTGRVARPSLSRIRNVAPVALTVACAGAFSFLSGGYIFTRSAPLVTAGRMPLASMTRLLEEVMA